MFYLHITLFPATKAHKFLDLVITYLSLAWKRNVLRGDIMFFLI